MIPITTTPDSSDDAISLLGHVDVRIVSFNCCLSVRPPLRYNGAPQRAQRLADSLYASIGSNEIDVICFQELLVGDQMILKQLIHHPFHTTSIRTSLFGNNVRLVPSGLFTSSRWKIVEEDAHVFDGATYHLEAFMAKAVQYCKIEARTPAVPPQKGRPYILHVFNTHLQAWTAPRACAVREEQARQIAKFVNQKLFHVQQASGGGSTRTVNEFAMIAGDWNIDDIEHRKIMNEILAIIRAQMMRPRTVQFSFDPLTNPLVGKDDETEYRMRTVVRHRKVLDSDAAEFSYPQTQQDLLPRQLVDGIALLSDSEALLESDTNVIPVKSRVPFEIHINMSTRQKISIISDHHAVHSRLQFRLRNENLEPDITTTTKCKNSFCSPVHFGWIIFELLLFIVLFWLLWYFFGSILNVMDRRLQAHHQARSSQARSERADLQSTRNNPTDALPVSPVLGEDQSVTQVSVKSLGGLRGF
jgi:hypothetical protein